MAKTQKFYRLRGRNVRYSTYLQSLIKGMFLTDQVIPEGYARVLVNYDIDDTGSCIRTRKGRTLHLAVDYEGYHKLGAMHLTDYIYTYNSAGDEIEDTKDLLMSFGTYGFLADNLEGNIIDIPKELNVPVFVSKFKLNTDTTIYDGETVVEPGTVTTKETEDAWALYCDKGAEEFNKVTNENVGFVSARTIKNAYVFDKKLARNLGLPISTVLSNEIYAFSGADVEATVYPSSADHNTFNSLSKAVLTKFKIRNTDAGYSLRREVITPKVLNPTEAQSSGYNMLSDSPYVFSDVSGGAPRALGIVPYPDRQSDIPVLNLTVGVSYALRVYYQYQVSGSTYQYKVEVLDATKQDSQYSTLTDWTNFTSGQPLYFDFIPTYAQTLVRVSIRISGQTATESQLPRLFDCESTEYSKLENKEFDLATAKGMISWLGCIGLYGVEGAKDTIFFSDIEDPSYFPFPNNTLIFDNEILAVHNYLDYLLVVTTDSITLITMGETIGQCTQRKIMANIFIPEIDAVNLIVLKDEVFFKTDTQFYVLKPNKYTSDATDLKHFTNSTAIANYTINFTAETLKILNRVFRPIVNEECKLRRKLVAFSDFDVINVQSAVKNEEVHYVYTIVPYIEGRSFGNLDLHLVYNTVTRSYRIYLRGIGGDETSHTALMYRNKQSGAFYEIIPYSLTDVASVLIVKESLKGRDDNIVQSDWQLTPYYNNYNYFDTGNVEIEDTYNKRYRELQMNILSREDSKIRFYTDVKVDGKLNVTSTRYEIQHITDPEDPEYGLIYVIPEEVDNLETMMTAYGNTTLDGEDVDLTKFWEVDLSAFPELDIATIKLKLWGKGRRASFQMLCTDLKNYELSSFIWVYRVMNVR